MAAARLPPASEPAKVQLLRPTAIIRSFCPYRARDRGPLSLASALWASCPAAPRRAAPRRPLCLSRGGTRRGYGGCGLDAGCWIPSPAPQWRSGRAATSIVPAISTRFGVLLLLGILKVLLAMRVDDSLAFPSPKAYPTHSETLTVGLLASFPRRSFHRSQLGTKAGRLTHRHK